MNRTTRGALAALLSLLLLGLAAGAALASTEHCPGEPGGNGANKAESVVAGDLNNFPLEMGVDYCVKAGQQASGRFTGHGDGQTAIDFVTWTNNGGQRPDVSYIVTYPATWTPSPEPTLVPTPEPTTAPTPEPTAEPTPQASGTPAPVIDPGPLPNTAADGPLELNRLVLVGLFLVALAAGAAILERGTRR